MDRRPWYAPVSLFLEQAARAGGGAGGVPLHARDRDRTTGRTPSLEIDPLLKAREDGIAWINDDLFRDGATVALLRTGDVAKARALFERMAEYVARKPEDVRVRLLGAHIVAAERKATEDRRR